MLVCTAAAVMTVRWITSVARTVASKQEAFDHEKLAVAQQARKSYENTLHYGKRQILCVLVGFMPIECIKCFENVP